VQNPIPVSFVLPCLNEAQSLPAVLERIQETRQSVLRDRETEIVVVDNGSTDQTADIARQNGARVIECAQRGYGIALQSGFSAARHAAVVFADADNSCDFMEAYNLILELEKGYDMVIGSRLRGKIHPGAMPFLHRYLGTPVLNILVNTLFAHKGFHTTDCNSGYRCFRREAFFKWQVTSEGMEFASEMLIKALKHNARISEVPVSLYPDTRGRKPHLKTWRDGMRHLLQILVGAPQFFNLTGLAVWAFGWIVLVISLLWGPLPVFGIPVFGLHTMIFATLGTYLGQKIWSIGLYLAAKQEPEHPAYRKLISMPEDHLLRLLVLLGIIGLVAISAIIAKSAQHGFTFLALEHQTLALIAFTGNCFFILADIFTAHLIKRL
jgi:glycosyltransferase involved in cell wall biosynthesis